MSPIDDELRSALHGRARGLEPSPDPLAGIERRARRMQRTRVGAAVAGSVLAVAAVAGIVPALQGTTGPVRPTVADAPPTLQPSPEPSVTPPAQVSYALDPEAPWAPRGEPVDEGTRATIQREYATRSRAAEVVITPLYAATYEPTGLQEVVFVARVDGDYRWGIAILTEGGPEFFLDVPLPEPAPALVAHLPGDEVDRLLVVAAPGTEVQFRSTPDRDWAGLALGNGIGVGPLESDASAASYRVLDPAGRTVVEEVVPPTVPGPFWAGSYGFDPADPWPFRGTEELADPNLAVEDERLFLEADPTRGNGGWSQRPLYAGDSDAGVSFLFMLHTKDGTAPVVTTTWRRGDRDAEQTEQSVEPGQWLIHALVPTDLDDGSLLLVALASPEAGIALDQPGTGLREDGIGDPGVGLWILDEGNREGMIRLYAGPDGEQIYENPVDVGPDTYYGTTD